MVLFIVFIVVLGVSMVWQTNESAEENYYEKDLVFEEDLKAKKNAVEMDINPEINFEIERKIIVIQFLKTISNLKIEADIYFQKPNNKKLNFKLPLTFDTEFTQRIPTSQLEKGIWNIWIKGTANKIPIQSSIKKLNIK
jgi:hypothetical protein